MRFTQRFAHVGEPLFGAAADPSDVTEHTESQIRSVAAKMVALPRGILAADESIGTMSSRLEAAGVEPTEENRGAYRALLLSAPGLTETVSGIIWCDETFRQSFDSGETFPQAAQRLGILPGIKVDTGTKPHPGAASATVTHGLDGLEERMAEYAELGASFAKWRAVIDIADPDEEAMLLNAASLAAYASICQANGIVPIVEPEVLCSGSHVLEECARVSTRALSMVFDQLAHQDVDLEGIVLKPNMITPGMSSPSGAAEPDVVAAATLETLRLTVPSEVPGIAFLSGGYSNALACSYLAAINRHASESPWNLTYSFGRALVSDALNAWAGVDENVQAAQEILRRNCATAAEATRRRTAV